MVIFFLLARLNVWRLPARIRQLPTEFLHSINMRMPAEVPLGDPALPIFQKP
jgi:hypothetical protein